MSSDIVERLRRTERFQEFDKPVNPDGPEAADIIERLRKRIEYAAHETTDPHTARTLNGVLRQTAMIAASDAP